MALKRNILTTFFTQFPVMILNFITGIIITRLIGAEGKGIYTIFIANTQLLALFLSLSANTGITFFISRKQIQENKIIGLSLLTILISALIGIVVVFFPMYYEELLLPKNFNSIQFKIYLFVSFIFTVINTMFSGVFQGYKKYGDVNKVAIFNSLANIILFGSLILFPQLRLLDTTLNNVLMYTLVAIVLNTMVWCWFYVKKITITPSFKIKFKQEIKPFFKYIGIGHASNVFNFFNYRLDVWFINSYHGLEQLGLYSLAVNVAQILLIASTPVTSVLFPYLTEERNPKKKIKLLALISRINTVSLIIGLTIFLISGKYLIPLIYGNEFVGSIQAYSVMIFATLCRGQTRMFSTYLASENKVIYNLYATIIGFFLTLILNILLIPIYGIIGAAISSVATYLGILLYVYHKTLTFNRPFKANYFIINSKDIIRIKNLINEKRRSL